MMPANALAISVRDVTMPQFNRIHVIGAPGSGTTTLGKALCAHLGHAFFDTDDFFWKPTTPPYQQMRDHSERLAVALTALAPHPRFVVSGSVCGWGRELESLFDVVVFLTVPTQVRLHRLVLREEARFGRADPEFLDWASGYDTAGLDRRSLALHEKWLSECSCPVIRLDGERPLIELAAEVIKMA